MAKKEKTRNPFQGVWVVVQNQQQDHNDKWHTQKRYRFGDYTLDFVQQKSGDYYIGRVREFMMGDSCDKNYFFRSKNAKLYIIDDNEVDYHTDTYRAYMVRNTLFLYNVTEIDDHSHGIPMECWFRLVLRRNTPINRFIKKILPHFFMGKNM